MQILKFILLFIFGCWLQVSAYYKYYVTGHLGQIFLIIFCLQKLLRESPEHNLLLYGYQYRREGKKPVQLPESGCPERSVGHDYVAQGFAFLGSITTCRLRTCTY